MCELRVLFFITFTTTGPFKVSYSYNTNYSFVLQVCYSQLKKVSSKCIIKMLIMLLQVLVVMYHRQALMDAYEQGGQQKGGQVHTQ